jgi:hypothetical protein
MIATLVGKARCCRDFWRRIREKELQDQFSRGEGMLSRVLNSYPRYGGPPASKL